MKFILFILFLAIVASSVYASLNWQKVSTIWKMKDYKSVNLIDLLSYANFYNGQNICTQGFYTQSDHLSIIKVSLADDEYTHSAWINNTSGKKFFYEEAGNQTRSVKAKVCGKFESHRGGEFGNPPVWNHQITVESFELMDGGSNGN